ncbi:MAG: hypothetical protein NZ908_03180 [Candidatus Micrarchaeota archaeon]|nr:hypothetical protein [Candidatus Micrarchaeota archaeon]
MKGQVGIEYLVIYAIALVILIIVVGLVLQMFTTTTYTPKCISDVPTLICEDNVFALYRNNSTGGNNLVAAVRLLNGNPKDIEVLGARCYSGKQAPTNLGFTRITGLMVISSQNSKDIRDIPCVNEAGTSIQFSSGAGFEGTVEILYKYTDDIVSNRTVKLSISGKQG